MKNKASKILLQGVKPQYKFRTTFMVLAFFIIVLFLHNYSIPLLPKLEFIMVSIYLFTFFKKQTNLLYKNRVVIITKRIFFMLAIWNVVSMIYGYLFTVYPISIIDISLSVIYLFMLTYFLFGAVLAWNYKSVNLSLIIIIISTIFISISIFEFLFSGFSDALKVYYNVYEDSAYKINPNNYRVVGSLMNSNNVGVMASILLLLVLYELKNGISKLVLALGFTIVIWLTGSRTGFVLLLVIATYYLLQSWRIKTLSMVVLFAVGIVLINNYFVKFENTIIYRRLLLTTTETALEARQYKYWDESIKIFYIAPITGVGNLTFISELSTTDNYYLDILKTNGIVGLLLWAGFIILLMNIAIKKFKSNEGKLLGGLIIVIMLSSFTGDFYASRLFYPLTFTLLGYYSVKLSLQK